MGKSCKYFYLHTVQTPQTVTIFGLSRILLPVRWIIVIVWVFLPVYSSREVIPKALQTGTYFQNTVNVFVDFFFYMDTKIKLRPND